ncbi:MAG: hypothetical protein JST59_00950 [Actinobacteria bacterium]|nr:hypothetical protein [Actinomycetota bacterium]
MRQNNVIVDVAETNLNSFTLDVEQVNFMIYHKECIAYSIHIKNFALSMVQHFLFNEMKITAYKVLLVDTHPNVGEWPEMLRVGYTK